MGSERSSRHLASCTEEPFPPWSWIHPWKQRACEAGGLQRREMKISPSQRDNTEFSEAREQTVAFITFLCPHSKQTIYSVCPNPNTFFPEFGCNRPQLKAVWRFMIFPWSFLILQNSYNYARNFSCTFLEDICSLQLTAQWQLSSLPTKQATLSALVPSLVQKFWRKTKQWWTKMYKDVSVTSASSKAAPLPLTHPAIALRWYVMAGGKRRI